MGLRYYDSVSGRDRIKPRYVWAFWAYLLGAASTLVLVTLVL